MHAQFRVHDLGAARQLRVDVQARINGGMNDDAARIGFVGIRQ